MESATEVRLSLKVMEQMHAGDQAKGMREGKPKMWGSLREGTEKGAVDAKRKLQQMEM